MQKHSKRGVEDVPTLLSDMDDSAPLGHHLPQVVASTASYSDRSSLHSSMSSSFSDLYQAGSGENPDLDLTGLVESTVDSDDEDTVSESASVSLGVAVAVIAVSVWKDSHSRSEVWLTSK